LIPFSEGAGFIAKRDNKRLDYFFKIVAHEVGHQWWAHQVIGANVQGLTLMSEVLAQYSALMVIKKEYDQARINEYVKYELEVYLRGRARETQKEVPLYLVENQGYIHYGKGLVVMNAVQDYIGEDNLNAALKKYIEKVGFQEPPYTISLEFIRYLKEATPDSLEYIITDMFETITLYQNRAIKATYKKLEKGQYLVKFEYEAIKLRADEQGNEKTIQISDYITFGIFGAHGEELYLKKHFVGSEKNVLEFVVDDVPEKAGIDPYYFLIDKHTDDNVINVIRE
jgi:ABC-2 type transport system permease protein